MEDGYELNYPGLRDVVDCRLRRAGGLVDMEPLPTITLDEGWAGSSRRRGGCARCRRLGDPARQLTQQGLFVFETGHHMKPTSKNSEQLEISSHLKYQT